MMRRTRFVGVVLVFFSIGACAGPKVFTKNVDVPASHPMYQAIGVRTATAPFGYEVVFPEPFQRNKRIKSERKEQPADDARVLVNAALKANNLQVLVGQNPRYSFDVIVHAISVTAMTNGVAWNSDITYVVTETDTGVKKLERRVALSDLADCESRKQVRSAQRSDRASPLA